MDNYLQDDRNNNVDNDSIEEETKSPTGNDLTKKKSSSSPSGGMAIFGDIDESKSPSFSKLPSKIKTANQLKQEAEEESRMLKDEGFGGSDDDMFGMLGLVDSNDGFPDSVKNNHVQDEMNALNEEDEWVRKVLLGAERTSLKMRASAQLHSFNKALLELRRERMELAADFCACEVTRLTRLRELRLLSEFEIKDQALANKIDKCTRDRGETAAAAAETKSKIRTKKEECMRCKQLEAEVTKDFMRHVPTTHSLHGQLLKIFKRKIKRTKKRAHDDNDDDDDNSDSDSEDDDDEDDDDEEEEGDDNDDACPAGCDLALYEEVLVLRVRRMDCEEKVIELTKLVDESEKAYTRFIAKEKQVEKELETTTTEVRKYQTEKQKTLNKLLTPIPLKISQLCCFDNKDPLGLKTQNSQTQQQMMLTRTGSSGNGTGGGGNDMDSSYDETSSNSMFSPLNGTQNNITGGGNNMIENGENSQTEKLPPSKLLEVAEFGQHCIFPAAGLVGLAQRINSLKKETEAEKVNLSELHKTKKLLERTRQTAEVSIRLQEEKMKDYNN
jgi:uncharacterized C2H2 Zn-finger protein